MLANKQALSHPSNMQATKETLERFIKKGNGTGEQAVPGKSQLQIISAQVLRASKLARNGYRGYNNGKTLEYDSRWTNLGFDTESDELTQAKLHGLYNVKSRFFAGRLACVHMYLRKADPETSPVPKPWYEEKNTEYVALFSPREPEILVPNDSYNEKERFPHSGTEIVIPDTPTWRQLDFILGQIEARPRQ